MIKNISLITSGCAAFFISGCSMLPFNQDASSPNQLMSSETPYIIAGPGTRSQQADPDYQLRAYPAIAGFYASHKQLDDYVAELAMQLYHNSAAPFADSTVAVAGFAELTPSRHILHPLSNALAEGFLQQMPRYGVTVVDHKLTGGIKLTAEGDAVFSNRAGQIAANQQIDYVLSGTVQHSQRGAMVNVRIMHLKNKTILASASQLIPQFVLDNNQPLW